MSPNPPDRERSFGPLGSGHTGLARLCVLVGFGSVFLVAVGSRLPDAGRQAVYWTQRSIVLACVLTALWLFVRNPRHTGRPGDLTQALGLTVFLALAALTTAFWPGVVAALLTPLLIAGSWLIERFSRD